MSEILDLAETNIFSIAEQHNNNAKAQGPKPINSVVADVFDKLNELSQMEGSITGLTTGFVELDNKTSGMQSGDLIIVAARPSMGKTTFAMNLVESVLFNNNLPALVYSMEMPADSIAMRLISSFGRVHQGHLRSGKMDSDEWSKVTSTIVHLQEKICISMILLHCRRQNYVPVRVVLPKCMAESWAASWSITCS